MTCVDQRKMLFFTLVERYCTLGRLLPAEDNIELDDAAVIAEAKIILAEMVITKAEIDALLG